MSAVPSNPAHHGKISTLKAGVPMVMVDQSVTTSGSSSRNIPLTTAKVTSVAGLANLPRTESPLEP